VAPDAGGSTSLYVSELLGLSSPAITQSSISTCGRCASKQPSRRSSRRFTPEWAGNGADRSPRTGSAWSQGLAFPLVVECPEAGPPEQPPGREQLPGMEDQPQAVTNLNPRVAVVSDIEAIEFATPPELCPDLSFRCSSIK
jgi:hypothetical protein